MANEIKISFIIPCYNCEKTVRESVDSILLLGLDDFEICMIDDGSTDDTHKILNEYKRRFPDIIKIGHNNKNIGAGATRNECFKLAKYEYIFMLDSDNILNKESFSKLLKNMKEEDDIMVFGITKYFYSVFNLFKIFYKDLIYLKTEMTFEDMRKTIDHPLLGGNYLYKRKIFESVNGYVNKVGVDTWAFGYKALVAGCKIKIIKNTQYFHKVHRKSYWRSDVKKNFINIKEMFLNMPHKLTEADIQNLKNCKNPLKIMDIIINRNNDFVLIKTSFLFKFLVRIYFFLWKLPSHKQ